MPAPGLEAGEPTFRSGAGAHGGARDRSSLAPRCVWCVGVRRGRRAGSSPASACGAARYPRLGVARASAPARSRRATRRDRLERSRRLATAERRAEARALVPDVYVHDREHGRPARRAPSPTQLRARSRRSPRGRARSCWSAALHETSCRGSSSSNKPLLLERESSIRSCTLPGGQREEPLRDLRRHSSTSMGARATCAQRVATTPDADRPPTRAALPRSSPPFVDANSRFDPEGTIGAPRAGRGARRSRCRSACPKATSLVARGETVTPEMVARLEAARGALVAARRTDRASRRPRDRRARCSPSFLYRYTTLSPARISRRSGTCTRCWCVAPARCWSWRAGCCGSRRGRRPFRSAVHRRDAYVVPDPARRRRDPGRAARQRTHRDRVRRVRRGPVRRADTAGTRIG